MELLKERYEWVDVCCLFYERECRDVCWVVRHLWGEVVRVLTPPYTNHELGGQGLERRKCSFVAENRPFVVKKRGRGTEMESIRKGVNRLNEWMKGVGRLGDVGRDTEAE